MQGKDHLIEPCVPRDDGRAVVVGQRVVAQLVDGAGVEGEDGLAGGTADVDAHVDVADALELLALVHPRAHLVVLADAVGVAQLSVRVVPSGEVVDLELIREADDGVEGHSLGTKHGSLTRNPRVPREAGACLTDELRACRCSLRGSWPHRQACCSCRHRLGSSLRGRPDRSPQRTGGPRPCGRPRPCCGRGAHR